MRKQSRFCGHGRILLGKLFVLVGLSLLSSFCLPHRAMPQEPVGKPEKSPLNMAVSAVDDLLGHFWVGNPTTGHIMDTYNGRNKLKPEDWQGILWERATFLAVLENLYQVTHDSRIRQRIQADWAWTTSRHTAAQLEACGNGSRNPAVDDTGWSALMYLNVYRTVGDKEALEHAKALVTHAFDRWDTGRFSGGLLYRDGGDFTTSYQAALILTGLRIYEITRDATYWKLAFGLYERMEKHLLRPDGLYWWVIEAGGPRRLNVIQEAYSETFLGGNMAMGVIHARFYHDTKQTIYKERALRTAQAIRAHETDGKGHYLDDRDAWANGYFVGEWAREVLTLPGVPSEDRALLRTSAEGVYQRARTSQGYYSACWNGPAEGDGCPWHQSNDVRGWGSRGLQSMPDQIMTSANAVNVIVAAAALETTRS